MAALKVRGNYIWPVLQSRTLRHLHVALAPVSTSCLTDGLTFVIHVLLNHDFFNISSSAVMWSVELDQWEGYLWKPQEIPFVNVNWFCTICFTYHRKHNCCEHLLYRTVRLYMGSHNIDEQYIVYTGILRFYRNVLDC
jgi:hypothetical protein